MKPHIKAFLISLVLVIAGAFLSKCIDIKLSLAMVEQAKAISYFVTLAGIVTAFSWYKRTAIQVEEEGGIVVPKENVDKQNRVLLYMVIINLINAAVLSLSTEESIQLMTGISLLVVIICPIVFRTMHEKDVVSPKEDDNAE